MLSTPSGTFPALKSFGRSVVSRCEQLGGRLTTLCGRGRSFKHISSSDFTLRSHAERQAVNFVVQGEAQLVGSLVSRWPLFLFIEVQTNDKRDQFTITQQDSGNAFTVRTKFKGFCFMVQYIIEKVHLSCVGNSSSSVPEFALLDLKFV